MIEKIKIIIGWIIVIIIICWALDFITGILYETDGKKHDKYYQLEYDLPM